MWCTCTCTCKQQGESSVIDRKCKLHVHVPTCKYSTQLLVLDPVHVHVSVLYVGTVCVYLLIQSTCIS